MDNIIEEVKRRIEVIRNAQRNSDSQLSRESIGALGELEDLLEWLEE